LLHWAGDELKSAPDAFQLDRITLLAFSAYFLLHIWRHIHQIFSLGVGKINSVVCVVLSEAVLLVSFTAFALVRTGELSNVYFSMVIALASIGGWHFPLIFSITDCESRTASPWTQGLHPLAKVVTP
jgi:hypothetical protein